MSPPHTGPIQRRRRTIPPKPVPNTTRPPTPHCRRPRKAVPHLAHDTLETQHLGPVEIERVRLPVQATRAGERAASEGRGSDGCIEHVGPGTTGAGVAGQARCERVCAWAAGARLAEECVVGLAGGREGGVGVEGCLRLGGECLVG